MPGDTLSKSPYRAVIGAPKFGRLAARHGGQSDLSRHAPVRMLQRECAVRVNTDARIPSRNMIMLRSATDLYARTTTMPTRLNSAARVSSGWWVASLCACTWAWPMASARADPAVAGTRNLAMADASRSSSTGTEGARTNPSALSVRPEFGMDVAYQVRAQHRTHGFGAIIGDSLNNPRFGIAMAYELIKAKPRLNYHLSHEEPTSDASVGSGEYPIDYEAHVAAGILSFTVVPAWLHLGASLEYRRTELTFVDGGGDSKIIGERENRFGLDLAVTLEVLRLVRASFVAYNLVGHDRPFDTDSKAIKSQLIFPDSALNPLVTSAELSPLANNPLKLAHGIALFPTRKDNFNLNFDGSYDFSSYRDESLGDDQHVRIGMAGSAEYVAGPVPIRLGAGWDGRGPSKADDITYISAGVGFERPTADRRAGVKAAIGFSQQVAGPKGSKLATTLSASLAITLDPRQ